MNKNNSKAYSEVYEIINLLEEEYSNRIPKKILDFFDEIRDKEYKHTIDVNKPLSEQNIERDAIILLAILDLNYWCDSEEEKKELLDIFNRNTEIKNQKNKELEEKYNLDNLFKKRQSISEIGDDKELSLLEYKEQGLFKRIIEKIQKLFKRRK